MPKSGFQSVDEYIGAQPRAVRPVLELVRATILKAVPEAREAISYHMPAYLLDDARLVHLAVWKRHYSIYAATARVAAAFREELAPYKVEKGVIRFPLSEPVPVSLIESIVKFRAAEISGRAFAEE